MKKLASLMLVLAMSVFTIGCGDAATEDPATNGADTEAPAGTDADADADADADTDADAETPDPNEPTEAPAE